MPKGGGGLNRCLYQAFPLSLHSSYGKLNSCLYLGLPLPLHSSSHKVKKVGGLIYMSLPGFAFVAPFIFSQGEKGGSFNICFPLSLHSSYGKVEKGGGFNICQYLAFPFPSVTPCNLSQGEKGAYYVSTLLSLCHSIHLMAR